MIDPLRTSLVERGMRVKRNTQCNRNTHIIKRNSLIGTLIKRKLIKKEHSYYQKGTNRNTHIKKEYSLHHGTGTRVRAITIHTDLGPGDLILAGISGMLYVLATTWTTTINWPTRLSWPSIPLMRNPGQPRSGFSISSNTLFLITL